MAREDKGIVDSYKTKNGTEYVSVIELSRRTGISTKTINAFIKDKKLKVTKEVGKKRYLEFEREKRKLDVLLQQNLLSSHKRIKVKTKEVKTGDTQETGDIEELEETTTDIKQLFKNFDPNDFKDCLAVDPDGNKIVDPDGNYILNWVVVDKKITAMIRNLELKRKEGDLIKIDEVSNFLTLVFAKTRTKLSNIADRYISRFTAFYKKETGGEISNETTTALKNMLEIESKNILTDLQKEIENSEYGQN